jgi:hypothetical protein
MGWVGSGWIGTHLAKSQHDCSVAEHISIVSSVARVRRAVPPPAFVKSRYSTHVNKTRHDSLAQRYSSGIHSCFDRHVVKRVKLMVCQLL